jgi:hypothetical protein
MQHRKIKLGKVLNGPASATGQLSPGYTLADNRLRSSAHDENASVSQGVRPSILYATVAAGLLLLVVVFVGESGGEASLSYNDPTILQEYEHYRGAKADPQLPTGEQMREELNHITFLEMAGRTGDARLAWQTLILEAKGDRENPVVPLALDHLKKGI